MSQVFLFLMLYLVGLAVAFVGGPRRRPWLCCALAFPVGLAVMVILVLALLLLHVPYGPWTLVAVGAVTLAGCVLRLKSAALDRHALRAAGVWTVVFAAACVALCARNVTLMSYDSHMFVMLGATLAQDGVLGPDLVAHLDEWSVFQTIAHSMACLTHETFLYSLPVLLGLSFVPLFALTLWHGLGAVAAPLARRGLWVGLVCVALFSGGMVGYHMLYLHTNWSCAVYLFGFVVLFWLAEVERDPSPLPLAFLCLIALALQRLETPPMALLFLSLTVLQSQQPRLLLARGLVLFVAIVGLWHEVLAQHVSPASSFLTPFRCRMVWLASVAWLAWWWFSDRPSLRRVNRALPTLLSVGLVLLIALSLLVRPHHMLLSAENWGRNLLTLPHWGVFWYAVVPLVLLAWTLPAPPFRQAITVGVPAYLGFVLLLAFIRSPYRHGVGDSANRMAIHIVPLIFWYLGVKVGPHIALASEPAREAAAHTD